MLKELEREEVMEVEQKSVGEVKEDVDIFIPSRKQKVWED